MGKFFLGLTLVLLFFVFGGFFKKESSSAPESIKEEKIEEIAVQKSVEITLKNEVISSPLEVIKKEKFSRSSILTREGVISWTNFFRLTGGLKSLNADPELNKIAETKLSDMLARQYFEHISPNGESISNVAKLAGYKFVLVGENLAMGDFIDDEDVVKAWMASPGHRENILRSGYNRIGVAAKKDFLKGRLVWVIVQLFAVPLSSCFGPEIGLLEKIELNKNQLESSKSHLDLLRDAIENKKYQTKEQYESIVAEHNSLVITYNSFSKETKNLIQQYNAEVEKFNQCVDSFATT